MSKTKQALKLFTQFLKFGCFTFGGGWSIVAQMKKQYVDREQAMSETDLLDLTSVGKSIPGTMIGNVAVLFGYRQAGFLGSAACLVGLVIPPVVIILIITSFYTAFQANMWVIAAMKGIRAAVVPIIISAIYGLLNGSFKYPPCFAIAVLTFALYLIFNMNCAWLVLIGAVLGLIICEFYERKEGKKNA